MYIFPTTVYDRPQQLLSALGSFWTELYGGKDQVFSYVLGKAQVEWQTQLDLLELLAALSRYTVPLYHRDNWYCLALRASQRNTPGSSLAHFGDGSRYDDGQLRFDVVGENVGDLQGRWRGAALGTGGTAVRARIAFLF